MGLISQSNENHKNDTTTLTPDSQNAVNASSIFEEPETRLRSRSRSTPPSGNGSEYDQDKAPVAQRRGNKSNPFARLSTQPRWHNQSYMLFLALRQHPDRCLPRTELIKAALAMDKKISDELKLPKVFRGKTPMNSASAILTNNSDRYFIPYKPEGSRSTHFKLAYEPCNFQHAVEEYRIWEKKLVEHDWPYCFGIPKQGTRTHPTDNGNTGHSETTQPSHTQNEIKELQACSSSGVNTADLETFLSATAILNSDTGVKRDAPVSEIRDTDIETERRRSSDTSESRKDTGINTTLPSEDPGHVDLNDLDLSNVPRCWQDIVEVKPSTIPNSGNGLFAARDLPHNTPLGFYFGVPMTEDEFDSLKDSVGMASQYSIMYRKTVLDATDADGMPYTDPEGEMYCPFHFMNENEEKNSNITFLEGALVNQVICWTKRDIKKGEELFVWYGRDVDRHWEDPKAIDTKRVNNKRKEKP
ncbi:hypothetical protein BGW37DRAFT_418045 [Umbelopsis sp. PMI_123]|nr:hypothetical protein BGW37DRAFT_418045 [Umbelopsis sp. PMI_123]